jgi:hypothetical protein
MSGFLKKPDNHPTKSCQNPTNPDKSPVGLRFFWARRPKQNDVLVVFRLSVDD